MNIRLLEKTAEIPYNLLLLADETSEAIDKYIHDCELYIYESENSIIAVYAMLTINKEEVEIKNIAVAEDHQGKGIGKLLLQDAVERAIDRNCSALTIGTGDVCFRQLYLYHRVGFEVYDTKTDFFLDNYPEAVYENGRQLKDMIMLRKKI